MTAGFLIKNTFNLLFKRKLQFQFDRIPLKAENISNKKLRNLFLIGLNRILPMAKTMGFPYMAHISPSGLCNLRCSICPTNDHQTKGRTLLPFETFKKFIDETGDYLIYVILWSWGEPLLNPDMYRMIKYAEARNILSVTSTNLNKFSREEAKKLVSSGLDALIIALDGLTQETYSKYRRGGNVEKVIEHTRMLVEEKNKTGTKKPLINLRMVVSKDNEHEIEDYKLLARDIGVDMVSFKAFSTRQSGYADPELDKRYAPEDKKYHWYKYLSDFAPDRRIKKFNCKFPWTKPTLFADGEILSCEFDFHYEHPFGSINDQSFKDIWFGPYAKKFRKHFKKNRDNIDFCKDCVFDYKLIPGCVVHWEILER
ncbi:MAG: radical SAM protein [Candidatus Aminicenantia bacterium]